MESQFRAQTLDLDWVTHPVRPGIGERLKAFLAVLGRWRRSSDRSDSTCPVCFHTLRRDAKRCRSCGEDISIPNPLAALKRIGIEWTGIEITEDELPPEHLIDVPYERLRLSELLVEVMLEPGNAYTTLFSPAAHRLGYNLERYPHQVATVQQVLGELNGRALLADEVGLGKTIESGLILAELQARQLCQQSLILVPPALLDQWYADLTNKLGLSITLLQDPSQLNALPATWLMSIYTAKGQRFAEVLKKQSWDLVIIDEAHRLRNRETQIHDFVEKLRTRYLLLLTATPLFNSLRDLHTLISLIRPGGFGNYRRFCFEFGISKKGRRIRHQHRLHTVLREVMVRNKRSTVGITLPPRRAALCWVALSPGEMTLYREMTSELRRKLKSNDSGLNGNVGEFQRRITSCPQSAVRSLAWIHDESRRAQLEDLLGEIRIGEKVWTLSKLVALYPDDRILIFSEFRESVEAIAAQLAKWGESVAYWHGGMESGERQKVLHRFRSGACRILVGNDALAEGQNLQHARILINFDLPWNPFTIEQRIGRVHRLGQKREVFIISLVARGTFEEDLARLLADKLHLFELSVGELDPIIGDLMQGESDFQKFLTQMAFADEDEREANLQEFSHTLNEAFLRRQDLSKFQNVLPELSAMGAK